MVSILEVVILASAIPAAFLVAHLIPFRPPQHRPVVFLLSAAFFFVFCLVGALAMHEGLSTGAVHCFGRRCDGDYLAARQPEAYWVTITAWYLMSVFFLGIVIGGVRLAFGRQERT